MFAYSRVRLSPYGLFRIRLFAVLPIPYAANPTLPIPLRRIPFWVAPILSSRDLQCFAYSVDSSVLRPIQWGSPIQYSPILSSPILCSPYSVFAYYYNNLSANRSLFGPFWCLGTTTGSVFEGFWWRIVLIGFPRCFRDWADDSVKQDCTRIRIWPLNMRDLSNGENGLRNSLPVIDRFPATPHCSMAARNLQ